MEPTAYCYGLELNNVLGATYEYCVPEYKKFVSLMKNYCSDTVLIAYEHHHVPLLINDILENSSLVGNFPAWPKSSSDRFDLVFIIDEPFTKHCSIRVTTQGLGLNGDSDVVPSVYEKYI
jgi:hypothetical protein